MEPFNSILSVLLSVFACFGPQKEEDSSRAAPHLGSVVTLMCASQLEEIPGLRSSQGCDPKSLRIVGEDTPTDCKNLETWYRIQRSIRSPAEAPDSGYDTRETQSEGYRISRTEIIKSPIGLELLADWLRIDKEASNKEKRKALIGILQESYLNERSHVRALAAQQGLPLDDIHAWFMNRVRELEAISFGGGLSQKTT